MVSLYSTSRADLCHNSAYEEVARDAAHARHHHRDVGEERPDGDPGDHHEGPAPCHTEDHVRAGERRGPDVRGEQAARHRQRATSKFHHLVLGDLTSSFDSWEEATESLEACGEVITNLCFVSQYLTFLVKMSHFIKYR